MPIFNVNDIVMLAGRPDRKGVIIKVLHQDSGISFYDVTFFDGQTGSYSEHKLAKAIQASDPWLLFANNQHKGYEEFNLVTTFHKVRNTTNNTLSTLRASRTNFKPYQYKPLVKFLNSSNRRILIADEVGLGKTIEAGHIMLELAARGELKHCLIICPKSLKVKWQDEMREKFNFDFKVIDSKKELINDFLYSVATGNPFKSIVTYGSVRTENTDKRDIKQELNQFLLELENVGQFFDLVVCDEAHYVRNTNLANRGLRKVVEASKAVTFLTATPLMTDIENLYNLLSILDNELFYDYTVFQNAIRINKPFIHALLRLNKRDNLKEIARELLAAEITETLKIGKYFIEDKTIKIGDYFGQDPLFNRVIKRLNDENPSPAILSTIQKDLTDLNSLNHLYTRTRKREVFTDGKIATRNAMSIFTDLSNEERRAYDKVLEDYSDEPLALVTKKRNISSCLPAYFTNEKDLLKGNINWQFGDAKFDSFNDIIKQVVILHNKKLIVFAFFRKTLLYLKIKLEKIGIRCILMDGSTENRQAVINEFRDNLEIKVFLSSQVGTEGVDLQFCNAIVNYDLPWNPMVVEQRIGRIDRIGQKEELIHIYNMVLKSTIEEQIHRRLLLRIQIFKESIGDLENILSEEGSSLDKSISLLEKELYGTKLTKEQQEKKIDDIAVAIETEKNNLEYITHELTDTMVNDIFFQNAINDIIKNQHYITKKDTLFYVRWFFREELPTVLFNQISDSLFDIEFPKNTPNILFDFISNSLQLDDNKELQTLFYRFKNRYRGNLKIRLTFDQEQVLENPHFEFISAYHPLIIAITNYIEQKKLHINQVFQYSLPHTFVSDTEYPINKGDYLLSVYKIIVERLSGKIKKKFEYLHPVVLDANNSESIAFFDDEKASFLFGRSQQHADLIKDPLDFNEQIIEQIRPHFLHELDKIQKKYEDEETIKSDSYKLRSLKQAEQYFQNRISRLEMQIEGRDPDDKVMPMFKKNLVDTIEEFEQRKKWIEETSIYVDNALISISYIQII